MMRRSRPRRSGNTLVEVLVGFGILGIGVTSVITLFPFSAITLTQALRDDRTTTCAIMADGQIRDVHRRYVVEIEEAGGISTEPYYLRMDDPQPGVLPGLSRDETGPSYPVFVDPMGAVNGFRGNVGDNGLLEDVPSLIPRVNIGFINNDRLALRYCSLLDNLSFDEDGNVPPSFDMRELRYNYAWMLQRPVNRDRYTVRMQVVVFNKRAHLYKPSSPELVYGATFYPGETTITNVPINAEIRRGNWILDATVNPNHIDTEPDGSQVARPLRHGEFYRVISVTEVGGTYSLEVHKPISRPDGMIYSPNTNVYAYGGTMVVMPAVADVFERQVMSGTTGP